MFLHCLFSSFLGRGKRYAEASHDPGHITIHHPNNFQAGAMNTRIFYFTLIKLQANSNKFAVLWKFCMVRFLWNTALPYEAALRAMKRTCGAWSEAWRIIGAKRMLHSWMKWSCFILWSLSGTMLHRQVFMKHGFAVWSGTLCHEAHLRCMKRSLTDHRSKANAS